MTKKLILRDISSSDIIPLLEEWYPKSNVDIYISLDMEIGFSDQSDGADLFYVKLVTPESLKANVSGPCLIKNRTIVVSEYSYEIVKNIVLKILEDSTRETFEESCEVLQRYFLWEYEDYNN